MQCRNHPDREAVAVCQKHAVGFCRECCDCFSSRSLRRMCRFEKLL